MTKPQEVHKTLTARRERYWQQLQVTFNMIAKLPENQEIFKGRCSKLPELASKFESTLVELEQLMSLSPDIKDDTSKIQLGFDELYFMCMSKYEALIPAALPLPQSPPHQSPSHQAAQVRKNLPEIRLPTFSGDLESFESFSALFHSLVNKNSSLSPIEKYSYLKAHLAGEPKLLVDAIPYDAASYPAALQELMHKYSNPRIRLAHHFNKLLNLQPIKNQSQLKDLVSAIHTNVEAIKRLQVPDLASAILLHIVLRLLDSKTRMDFERAHAGEGNTVPSYGDLLKFLQNQCLIGDLANFEMSIKSTGKSVENLAAGKSQGSKPNKKASLAAQATSPSQTDQSRPSNSYSSSSNSNNCKVCNKASHRLAKCFKFLEMPIPKRIEFVRSGGYCMVCLFTHPGKPCSSQGHCRWCSDTQHNSYLCSTPQSSSNGSNSSYQNPPSTSPEIATRNANSCRIENQPSSSNHVLLGTALVRIRNAVGQWYGPCRALCDSGSEVNFISESLAQALGLTRKSCPFQVSGIGQTGPLSVKGMTSCTLSSLHDSNQLASFEVIITPTISVEVPSSKLPSSVADQFAHLPLADPKFYSQSKVDLLLGVQAYLDILSQPVSIIKGNPSATQTIFGYVLSGNVEVQPNPLTYRSFMVQVAPDPVDETLRRFWECEEVQPANVPPSPEEEWCENHFRQTIKRDSSGRYIASLPWKEGVRPVLGSNREIALHRFRRLENRFRIDESYAKLYKDTIRDYIQQGLAVPASTSSNYLLTHHGVRKDSSTSPLRVVFNPSETCSTTETLNSHIHTGPKLQSDIGNITLLYRLEPVALTCDVKGMFLAISLAEEDRKYQHFLFRFDPHEPIQEWELTCLIFGMVCSPYIAQRVIQQLCEDEKDRYPRAAQILSNCCYVDNIVCTASSYQDALEIHHELTELLACGGFILRKWASSDERVSSKIDAELRELPRPLNSINTEAIRVLGTEWDPVSDSFRYAIDRKLDVDVPNKRSILSQISRVYDLNGYVNPFIFFLKSILQRIWLEGLQWDELLSEELQLRWIEASSDLPNLSQIVIPRYIMGDNRWQSVQLIGFGDASELGYGAVLYLRVVQEDGTVLSNLIRAKSKVAPLKTVSIPRLELNAAVLLTRLVLSVKVMTDKLQIQSVHLFTDSTTTLAWIHTPPYKLATFVANRVVYITDNSSLTSWRYVPSEQNPADIASRGLSASELASCELWWHGPAFLFDEESSWPERRIQLPHNVPELKARKVLATSKVAVSPIITLIESCSTLGKATRVVVYVHRFIKNWFLKPKDHVKGPMSAEEMNNAMNCLVKATQQHFLAEDLRLLRKGELSTPKYHILTPFISDEGFVRVGGRLGKSPLPEKAKHPLLIPHESPLSSLIIDHYHLNSLHGGPRIVMALTLRYYWIPSIRRLIRFRLHKCKICFTLSAKPKQPKMADLPSSRFAGNRCFNNTAIDFCGPFTIKENRRNAAKQKAYGAIFVCMTTKATHLELVSSLSTDACLAALDRFIARRGLPSRIYSDQGRNFIGCSRELKELNALIHHSNSRFIQHLGKEGVKWIHSPPYAPNFNGLVEAAVKSTKHHLKRIMTTLCFTFEEMYTLFTRIEAVLNSRPLCPVPSSPSDGFDFLTPGHFLTGGPLLARPEIDLTEVPMNHMDRWQLISHSLQSFWTQWKKEYLHTLMQRTKWTKPQINVKVGDLVLLYDPSVMPLNWPMGRVEDVSPGEDGVVRVVKVRTPTGSITRPTSKVVALPINE